ncbi:hypothetical protein MLD38_017105 [Melastoma candidum]|nr:hypothetical protein MLD38_017105 [Melastoma candidum]
MKPTVCSQRKCGISYGAGLVNFPIKKQSNYKSEFGDSGSSLVDLKSLFSTGNRTESSQGTSVGECEAKTDICSRKGSSYFPDDRKERIVGDTKYRLSKRIPTIPLSLQDKNRQSRWSSEDDLFLCRSSIVDFQSEDRAGLVRQGSDFGGLTSGTDMKLADSSSDSLSASTSETVTEAGEPTKCQKTLSPLDDHADISHQQAEVTHDYDNPAQEDRHECHIPESNAETEDTGPSSTGGLLQFRVRKALFHSDTKDDNAGKLMVSEKPEETGRRKTAPMKNLRLKIVQFMLVLLIGVGLRGLGFEHDFFHGLIF